MTIDLDPALYRAIKVEAARTDRSVRDIADEALETRATYGSDDT